MASSNSSRFSKVLAVVMAGALATSSTLPVAFAQAKKPAAPAAKKPEAKKPEAKKPEAKKPEAKPAAKPAAGGKQDPKAAARKAYGDGEKAYGAGDYAKAEESFKKANEILPSPNAMYWIAMSLDKQGKYDDALAAFDKVLGDADAAKLGDEKLGQVRDRLAELRAKKGGELSVITTPTGATVSVDGEPQAGETPMILKLSPGTHKITVTNPGYEKQEFSVDVSAGQKTEKSVEMKAAELAPPAPPTTAPPAEPATAPPAQPAKPAEPRSKVPAYVTLGIAGAGALVGTWFGIQAMSAKKDFDDKPTTDNADKVERNALIADMSFGVAITLGVTGIVLLTAGGDGGEAPKEKSSKRKAPRKAFHVAPFMGPTGGGAAARLTF